MKKVLIAVAVLLIGAILFLRPDIYPALGTYGLSVGINDHYCSAELVHLHPTLSCESAS